MILIKGSTDEQEEKKILVLKAKGTNRIMNQMTENFSHEYKKCLIIFSHRSAGQHLVLAKFNLIYETEHFFADEAFRRHGSIGIIEHANHLIDEKHIDIVVFDCDLIPYIDCAVISKISDHVVKILITYDDLVMHNLNAVNAYSCDMVISTDPISVLKYREKGINSEFVLIHTGLEIYKPMNLKSDIDILFFGSLDKEDRKAYLDYLEENGFNLKVVGQPNTYVSQQELVTLINRSKIVLNFSQTHKISDYRSFFRRCDCVLDKSLFQLKGRIFEIAFCKVVCISEYTPALGLLFNHDEVPMFRDKSECLTLIRRFLNNETLRKETAERLYQKVMARYEETIMMAYLGEAIKKNKKIPKYVPQNKYYWSYVTRFKLNQVRGNPSIFFKETGFLYKNGILYCLLSETFWCIANFPRILARYMWHKFSSGTRFGQ